MAATTKATKATKATAAPAPVETKQATREAYRVEFAAQVAALRVVGATGRLTGNGDLLDAYRALIKQTYRPAGSVVRWAKPEHRTAHGKATPDNGSTMSAFVAYVDGLLGNAPTTGEPGHAEHKAARAALAAFAKVVA